MSLTAAADAIPAGSLSKATDEHSLDMADNEIQGQGEAYKRSYDNDDNEDPATQAASENLKHASISEKEPLEGIEASGNEELGSIAPEEIEDESARPITPGPAEPSDAQDEEMKERVSSPKKKRGREQDDEARDLEAAGSIEEAGSSPNGNAVNGGRTTRMAPEKKRHRDASVDTAIAPDTGTDVKDSQIQDAADSIREATSGSENSERSPEIPSKPVFGSNSDEKTQTSASAFASSGFSSLAASSTSGFAALAASKPSVFGTGGGLPLSGFGALAGSSPVIPDTSTTTKFGLGGATTAPLGSALSGGFGDKNNSAFGALEGGFGGGFSGFSSGSGPKLSSFAALGTPAIIGAEKPAKAFGAPESDEEEDESEDDDESRGGAASDEDESVSLDDKKKHRVGRVPINDGEEGEATLLQFRAKLFTFVSGAWKERGSGTLKLNVPRIYVDYDEHGIPIPGSFDPSARGDSDEEGGETVPTVARLIMRQENTHRVILNTAIMKAFKFEQKSSASGPRILFTAWEEGKPVNMVLRMNEANANLFTSEIRFIQKEL